MTDFKKVIDFENMYKAYRKSKCGKGYKKSAAKFNIMALDGINILIEELKNKTYKISPYNEFKVYEPKERVIKTTSFKDKVVQHSLCDNVILPKLQEVFIYDNCAGQKGKGTLFGLNRLSEHMKAFYKRYGSNGYILKCDITKFFYNISHQQLKDIVNYYFSYDENINWLCNLFIDSTEGKGIPLGNQINQGFALLYLDGMDKLIKGDLGIEYYGRYMDDFYIIHQNKGYLKYCLEIITKFLDTLDLTLNGKTQIFPFKNGVSYLGFHTYITATGKTIRKLKNQNKRKIKEKLLYESEVENPMLSSSECAAVNFLSSMADHSKYRMENGLQFWQGFFERRVNRFKRFDAVTFASKLSESIGSSQGVYIDILQEKTNEELEAMMKEIREKTHVLISIVYGEHKKQK